MKVLFAYDGFPLAIAKLRERLPQSRFRVLEVDGERPLTQQVGDVDVLVPSMAAITRDVMAAAPRLKLIVQYGVGLEGVDIEEACRRGIYVTNTPGVNSISVAEHALFLMLALARRLPLTQRSLEEEKIGYPTGNELHGKTLGIIGFGNSGRELARMAKSLGMKVLAVRRTPREEDREWTDFLGRPRDLNRVLTEADFVSLHSPLTPETEGMIDKDVLAKMKPTAFLINVARGPLVNHDDLVAALRQGVIAGAGLDVFWTEPPDPFAEIFSLDNVVATPHVAGVTYEAYDRSADQVAAHILQLEKKGVPQFHYS